MSFARFAGHRGTMAAAAFVLDTPVLGEDEARQRVLQLWSSGAALRTLPDGRWLLLLGEPVVVRGERAPGLVAVSDGGVLVAAGADPAAASAGELIELRHGAQARHDVAALAPIDPRRWIDLGARREVALDPLDAERAATPVAPVTEIDDPDLRDLAKVERKGSKLRQILDEAAREPERQDALKPPRRRGRLARLVLRTPAGGVVGRRHARYLDRLTRAFEAGDYENALRDAIRLGDGGPGGGWLTLRLPSRRTGALTPTARTSAGGAVPWGSSAHAHLAELYRRAAERLEQEGEIERAAFVHADLLLAPRDAVALLERHGRLELAARLAEGRELDADLVVRLWWQAGDRDRAVDIARARGAWAGAIDLLAEAWPQSALAMRAAWVAAEQQAGNHLAAVEAAWPAPVLRADVGGDLELLRMAGGPTAATALALQLAWRADERFVADAIELVDDRDTAHAARRAAFATALAERPAADPTTDRRLSGQALRALLRDAGCAHAPSKRAGRAAFNRLRERADPLLRGDLPAYEPSPPALSVGLLRGPAEPGTVSVHDAVALPGGVLVACGERGLRLVGYDGRVRNRWSVPADRLVVADHGATVLVAAQGERLDEMHRLELSSREIVRWASLPRSAPIGSFDGGILTLATPDRLTGVDTFGPRPRELWSALDPGALVIGVRRCAGAMAALVDAPLQGTRGERSLERWVWELPSRTLRRRDLAGSGADWPARDVQITADGTLFWLVPDELGLVEHRLDHARRPHTARAPAGAQLVVSEEHSALLVCRDDEARLTIRDSERHDPLTVVAMPAAASLCFRVHGAVATVWAPDGRIVAVDLVDRSAIVDLRVRA